MGVWGDDAKDAATPSSQSGNGELARAAVAGVARWPFPREIGVVGGELESVGGEDAGGELAGGDDVELGAATGAI